MHDFNLALLVVAGSALVLGLLSKPLKSFGLPDSVTLLALGVALGPQGLEVFDPASWRGDMAILEQVARLAVAVGLMGVALRLPRWYVVRRRRALAVVLGVGMVFMWLASSAVIGIALGLPPGAALLLGAVVTPTDPVVASAIVTGPVAERYLPGSLRRIISSESGANDGLAYLFVMVGIFLVTVPPSGSLALGVAGVVLVEIVGAVAVGGVIGLAAGFALRQAEAHDLIEQPSVLMFTTALALATLAGVRLLGSDGILAVFAAGLAFDHQVNARERQQEERVVDGVDRFFTSPIFLLLGLMLPWQAWGDLGWPGVAAVLGVLLLRRLPLFVLIGGRIADLGDRKAGAFAGWFGPIGVAAVYYAAFAHHQAHVPELWPMVSLLVATSILVHGLTAMPFSRWFGVSRASPGP
ncbi:MAG: cation:proton antiporter [Pseudomonadota bacterium]